MDTPAPTLVMGSGTGKPCCGAGLWSAGNGCWLEVEVSKAGDRVVGTFQGRVGPGGCSENIGGDVNGAFDIGYSPCPWQ